MVLQNYLANYSFLTLLGSMIFYWIETSFTGIKNVKHNFTGNKSLAKYGIILSNILLFLLLLLRWKESGHFPLSNLYESLMFLSWCFTVLHLYIMNYTLYPSSLAKAIDKYSLQKENNEYSIKLFGAITTPSALLTNAFASFTLPKEMQEASPLVPALQSNWLMMHVTVMILSYAALIGGSLLSIAFLIVTVDSPVFSLKKNASLPYEGSNSPSLQTGEDEKEYYKYQSIALTLDNLSYRILGIGFPLLTIGILSGAVWANEAWGSYWSWDPKETWALLTWLIFAIYLHTRLSKGWEGKKPAIIASFGFVIVWICYLGVNLLGEGLHSYGWLVQS
jgi:cytochrome c-type biogenesis protein CcsB